MLEALINDKATLDLKWKEVLTMSEIYEVIKTLNELFKQNI